MEIDVKTLNNYKYVEINFNYENDKDLVESLITKATSMTNKVNPHGPDGNLRPQDVRFNKVLGGLLAEMALIKFLELQASKNNVNFKIIDSTFNQEEDLSKLGFNQIDLKISANGLEKDLEIRSSYSYKTTFERLLGFPLVNGKGAFSIIGWYKSQNKPLEVKKDYYVFAIHRYLPSETQTRIFDKVTVYIAGAASKYTLEKRGENKPLLQNGAEFRVINPLTCVPDPIAVVDEILDI
jgi:hypothetical protein